MAEVQRRPSRSERPKVKKGGRLLQMEAARGSLSPVLATAAAKTGMQFSSWAARKSSGSAVSRHEERKNDCSHSNPLSYHECRGQCFPGVLCQRARSCSRL
jgi:hypothetical protein